MRLDGKVAIITGSAAGLAGRLMGFGGAAAWAFAKEGAAVVISDINEELGEQTAAQIQNSGAESIFCKLDVTSEEDWEECVETTIAQFGKIDILVNNAGTASRTPVEDTTIEIWDSQMEVHAKGTFLGTRSVIPGMKRSGEGSIVNVSSIFGIIGSPSSTAYHAAKGSILAFTKATAIQYARENIRANAILPGYFDTPMSEAFSSEPELVRRWTESVPMNRFGRPEEVAGAMLYLASDEASYVTGIELVIDGGVTAQ